MGAFAQKNFHSKKSTRYCPRRRRKRRRITAGVCQRPACKTTLKKQRLACSRFQQRTKSAGAQSGATTEHLMREPKRFAEFSMQQSVID
jgi:hypothetical protein